jgi:hypothetical protein
MELEKSVATLFKRFEYRRVSQDMGRKSARIFVSKCKNFLCLFRGEIDWLRETIISDVDIGKMLE